MDEALIKKARQAANPEELLALADAENVELSEENAEAAFAQLHVWGELSDNELDSMAGGGCTPVSLLSAARFCQGAHVMEKGQSVCGTRYHFYRGAQYAEEDCRSPYWVVQSTRAGISERTYVVSCPKCGMSTTVLEGQLRLSN